MDTTIKQHVVPDQVRHLEGDALVYLIEWYWGRIEYDDDVVAFWIPGYGDADEVYRGPYDTELELPGAEEDEYFFAPIRSYEGKIVPLLSIGEMVEFLHDNCPYRLARIDLARAASLCDDLWQQVNAELMRPMGRP